MCEACSCRTSHSSVQNTSQTSRCSREAADTTTARARMQRRCHALACQKYLAAFNERRIARSTSASPSVSTHNSHTTNYALSHAHQAPCQHETTVLLVDHVIWCVYAPRSASAVECLPDQGSTSGGDYSTIQCHRGRSRQHTRAGRLRYTTRRDLKQLECPHAHT